MGCRSSKAPKLKLEDNTTTHFKVIICGTLSVGKTTIIKQFLDKRQSHVEQPSTQIQIYQQTYTVQGHDGTDKKITLKLWDTPGGA